MKIFPTLYSRTATGAIQTWKVIVDGDSYYTEYGHLDGVITSTNPTVCKGTNINRSNENSPEDQALFEAKATWKKKRDTGYHEKIENIDESFYVEPMLAKKWEDRKSKVKFPVYCQPKLDGCLHGYSMISLENEDMKIHELYELFLDSMTKDLPKIKTYNETTGQNEYKSIKCVMLNGVDIKEKTSNWYKITTDSGKELVLTGNHRVWVDNLQCWRRVDELDGTETLKNSI